MSEKTIITVDDESKIVELVKDILSINGYNVITAISGREAITKAKEHGPDLIIMDIMMPDLDGAKVAKLLKEDSKTHNIPILFLSGIVVKEMGKSQADINVGGNLYRALPKPFGAEELLNEVHKLLEN